jgi:hypothetical protein
MKGSNLNRNLYLQPSTIGGSFVDRRKWHFEKSGFQKSVTDPKVAAPSVHETSTKPPKPRETPVHETPSMVRLAHDKADRIVRAGTRGRDGKFTSTYGVRSARFSKLPVRSPGSPSPLNREYLRSCKACGRRIHTEIEHKSRVVLLFLRQKDDAVFPWRQRRACRDLRPRTIWEVNNCDGDFVFLAT